jgi:sirohydrochlorin ferrochelatase
MKALLLVAHGSRRQASNDEVHALAKVLKTQCQDQYELVTSAFLELAEPSIPDGIVACAKAGAKTVIVLPYFLNSGRHVTEDIPHEVAEAKKRVPHIEIKVAPHIGSSDSMIDLLIHSAGI